MLMPINSCRMITHLCQVWTASTCIHCGETQHDPTPRLLVSQAWLMPAVTSMLSAMVGQTTQTDTHMPLPSSLLLPTSLSHTSTQPGPLPLSLQPSHFPISQNTVERDVLFYAPGLSVENHPLGIAPTTGSATALPYSMYTATLPYTQVLGKRKRAQGRTSQLLLIERVVVDYQAVSCECDFLLLMSNNTLVGLHSLMVAHYPHTCI